MIRLIWLEEVSNFVLKSSLKWISEKNFKELFQLFSNLKMIFTKKWFRHDLFQENQSKEIIFGLEAI